MKIVPRFILHWSFGICIAIFLGLGLSPASAQLFDFNNQDIDIPARSDITVNRQGTIEYAIVRLDGRPLFPVAAEVQDNAPSGETSETQDAGEENGTVGGDGAATSAPSPPTARERVRQVENNLAAVLAQELSPNELRIVSGSLNDQAVIFASDRTREKSLQIVTITDLDVKLAGQTQSEVILDWVSSIREALERALQERQPQFLWKQVRTALKLFGGLVGISLLVAYNQRILKQHWNRLLQKNRTHQLTHREQMEDEMKSTPSLNEFAMLKPLKYLSMGLPLLTFMRRSDINITLRRLLQWIQLAIWLGGVIAILYLFPQTRDLGRWLSQVPVNFLGIVLVAGLANKLGAILIDYALQMWAEQEALKPTGFQRQAYRTPTLSVALKGLLMSVCFAAGLIWFLYELRVPMAPVLTGAGIIGFAFSLSAQNLIRDMINGILILSEDQYAVGDVIAIDSVIGFVEFMDLRITQLRTSDGELVSIPNSAITMVRNLSNGWSRVDFEIEVSYETDIDKAMGVMETVIEDMRLEPIWCDRIIEPAEILGVDRLTHTGTLIRIWIKTQPLQQWNVSREFRRRLKRAFEDHNIPLGVPQQHLWVRNAHDLAIMEQVVQSHSNVNSSPDAFDSFQSSNPSNSFHSSPQTTEDHKP
ncbi:MAG: mechanosensitive ion channel family protein [Leptolyngbya sp. SIO1E4]|nr:mechanosensitive ion channel family protein [Leptolyngbya sp. SIO1E4]